ncbi:MAG: PAS domain-containing protein, partial [Bdellovibrionales bacterium]|nr:PAS domain-containing protein [Bdellovibrionales bacterium]
MNFVIEKKYERAHRKVSLLEKMIEDKTRELYLEHQKVEKSNQYLSRILQSMAGGVIVTDHTFTVVLVNGAAAIILGEESENLLGSELLDVFPVDGIAQAIEERAYHDLPSEQTELVLARNPDGRPI